MSNPMSAEFRMARNLSIGRSGMTIIEVLIATTLTLLMMLALAQGFKTLSQSVSQGRAKLTLSDQLRGITSLLRADLEGRTTDSSTPQSNLSAKGYLKIYDGPLSDASAVLFNHLPASIDPKVERVLSASKWGDLDDILMLTVKAKPGEVFRGKIPRALLVMNRVMQSVRAGGTRYDPATSISDWSTPDANGNTGWAKMWNTDVTISSEYAEVVWFAVPLNENFSIDPTSTDMSVIDVVPGADRNGDGINDPDGLPDKVALCRRVLLIRSDLDLTPDAALISSAGLTAGDYLTMQPQAPNTGDPNSFRLMMRCPYQRCDLSLRPQGVTLSDGSTFISLKTNTLEDLQRPENRFAHYVYPISTQGSTLASLALSTESTALAYRDLTNGAYSVLGFDPTLVTLRDRGFMPWCFMRTKPVPNGTGYTPVPLLEEVVASNVVSFDLKGFDSSVKQIAHPGPDKAWGAAGVDDDGANGVDDIGEAGWPGTDDLSLSPSDPGYALQMMEIVNYGGAGTNPYDVQSGMGAFVDIGWGSKVIASYHPRRVGVPVSLSQASSLLRVFKYFRSALSCLQTNASLTGLEPSSYLYNSGAIYSPMNSDTPVGSMSHQVYQPSFDTFTDAYEFDGESFNRSSTSAFQSWRNGLRRFGFTIAQGGVDASADGLGYDRIERESSPPIPYTLPSIQATVRVQDGAANALQQMSVVHDLIEMR